MNRSPESSRLLSSRHLSSSPNVVTIVKDTASSRVSTVDGGMTTTTTTSTDDNLLFPAMASVDITTSAVAAAATTALSPLVSRDLTTATTDYPPSAAVLNDESIACLLQQISSLESSEQIIENALMKIAHACTDTLNPQGYERHRQFIQGLHGQLLIVNTMTRCLDRPMIQYAACRALACSICSMLPAVKEHVAIENKAFDATVMSIQAHKDNVFIHMSGCHFLANVISSPVLSSDVIDVMSNRGIDCVLESMRVFHDYLEMQRIGCLFFYNVSCHCNKEIVDIQHTIAIIEVVVVAMNTYPTSRSLHYLGCYVLLNIRRFLKAKSDSVDSTQNLLIEVQVKNAILSAVKKFPEDHRILHVGKIFFFQKDKSKTVNDDALAVSVKSSKSSPMTV